MLKNTLIIALLIALIYLYYQQKKTNFLTGNNSDSTDTIRDLQTQLQQAHQLQTYNSQQLTNYESQVNRLQTQLQTYQQGEDWETKTGEIITNLEQEVQELTTERDEAIREQKTSEQETLALHNRLKNKQEEINKKLEEAERLKKEKSQSEIALNKTITELKEKYRKREKLLDEEQLEGKKLTEENEQLQEKIKALEQRPKSPLPGSWDYEEELTQEIKDKDKQIAELETKLVALTLPTDPLGNTSEEPYSKPLSHKEQQKQKK